MSVAKKVVIEKRSARGSRASRKMRAQGIVPGNVFGHKEAPVAVSVKREDIDSILHTHDKVVDLECDGKIETAVVTELQWDTFGININHIDFQRVDPNERVEVEINIVLKGLAPGVVAGGTLDQSHRILKIECPVVSIPHEIVGRVGKLEIGDSLLIKDLELGEGVHPLEEDNVVVAHVVKAVSDDEDEDENEESEND